MGELRKDPVSGRWVIVASERRSRPSDFHVETDVRRGGFCPFCEGNEDKTPHQIASYPALKGEATNAQWAVRVVPNKFPALGIEGSLRKRGVGVYDMMNGVGAHEVIIETPAHVTTPTALSDPHFGLVVRAYADRLLDLQRDRRFAYGLVFKNVGRQAGASLEHTHSQLIVTPVVPLQVATEMQCCKQFDDYRGRCLLCDIVMQEIEDGRRVVEQTDNFLVVAPYASRFPFEMWILPKTHSAHFTDMNAPMIAEFASVLRRALSSLEVSLQNPAYNYILHTSPFGVGEIGYYHWHVEIIPRLTRIAGFEWGTGFYINTVAPEEAADYLRKTIAVDQPVH